MGQVFNTCPNSSIATVAMRLEMPEMVLQGSEDNFLERYKLYVEIADRVSQRKNYSIRLYVSLLSTLAATMVIASKIALPEGNLELVVPLLSYLGMWLAVIWLMRIISYDVVISAKQKVIREMETKMAIPGYTRELEILNTGALSFFHKFSRVTVLLPVLFLAAFFLLMVLSI